MIARPSPALRAAACLVALLFPAGVAAQDQAPAADPFAEFETHRLANGLRVWVKRLPGAPDVSVGAVVPYGWDQDPPGKEGLAHFTEHMLFGDHAGRTEEQILDEIESRGGRRNGITTPDHTFYYVTLPREHGLYGVEWLGRVLEPKAMEPAVVARNRQPVALEIGARPRQLLDRVAAALDPEWLRYPDYWAREFGLETRGSRAFDPYASLQAIGPDDLRAFQARYYAPGVMTVVVVGDVDTAEAVAEVERAFGPLPPRPAPTAWSAPVDPDRPFRAVTWTVRPDVRYQRTFKLYGLDADDHLRLLFLARYLERRLSLRLRFGEVKAVYAVTVQVVRRGPAVHLLVSARIDPAEWRYAREVVEEEWGALADASVPAERFRDDRAALVEQLRAENREAEDLVFWVHDAFWPPDLHADLPDLAAAFAAVEPDDLAPLMARMGPDRQAEWITRPLPVGQGWLLALAAALAFLTLRLAARALVRPVDMTAIRYVARIKAGPLALLFGGAAWVAGGAVVARLLVAVGERVAHRWVLPVDVFAYQAVVVGATGAAALALTVAWLSVPPRKLLLFDDHLRVKHLAFRSRRLDVDGLDVRRASWADVWRAGAAFRTLPLVLGLSRRAVWIRPAEGLGYLVGTRRPDEFVDTVRRVVAEAGAAGPDAGSAEGGPEDPVQLGQPVRFVL